MNLEVDINSSSGVVTELNRQILPEHPHHQLFICQTSCLSSAGKLLPSWLRYE